MGAVLVTLARHWFQVLVSYLRSSDYLNGMVAWSVAGIARDGVAVFLKRLRDWIIRQLWVTVSLSDRDAELLLSWLRERPEVHSSPQLALFSQTSTRGDGRLYEYEPEIQTSTVLRYVTKKNSRHWIWITRKDGSDFDAQSERRLRGVQVSFFGRGSKVLLEEILEAGREIQRRKREKYLSVVQVYDFGKDYGLGWLHPQESDRKQPGRSIASVVLPQCPAGSELEGMDQAEALLEDAREFLASESWYSERGIPYRRGYLLHGIPGGGKSSLIMAVASELRLPIYMLQLSSELISDETLNSLLQHGMHDPPTILLLEDVDLLHTATLNRHNAKVQPETQDDDDSVRELRLRGKDSASSFRRKGGGRLTLSGLLNALDGPTATTGRLLFMTTNAKHRLDPALIRSGRIDYEIEFKSADREQICRFVSRFYSDFGRPMNPGKHVELRAGGNDSAECRVAKLAAQFADEVEASGVELTTADIQRHLMRHKKDVVRALQELPLLLKSVKEASHAQAAGKRAPDAAAAPASASTVTSGAGSGAAEKPVQDTAAAATKGPGTNGAGTADGEGKSAEEVSADEVDRRTDAGAEAGATPVARRVEVEEAVSFADL